MNNELTTGYLAALYELFTDEYARLDEDEFEAAATIETAIWNARDLIAVDKQSWMASLVVPLYATLNPNIAAILDAIFVDYDDGNQGKAERVNEILSMLSSEDE